MGKAALTCAAEARTIARSNQSASKRSSISRLDPLVRTLASASSQISRSKPSHFTALKKKTRERYTVFTSPNPSGDGDPGPANGENHLLPAIHDPNSSPPPPSGREPDRHCPKPGQNSAPRPLDRSPRLPLLRISCYSPNPRIIKKRSRRKGQQRKKKMSADTFLDL